MAYRVLLNRQATVFGGSGFIGRYIVQRLAKRGWRVAVAVRNPAKASFLRPLGSVGQIAPVFCNIRDEGTVAAALRDTDLAINLVGTLEPRGAQSFKNLHVAGAANIGRAAAEAGVERVMHISALGANVNSESVYARTKAAGEDAMREAFPEATILRPGVAFGPEDQFFNRFASMARHLPFLPLIGGGHTRFQPVYVGDVADAVMAALDDPETAGRTYELGGPRIYTMREIMELVLAVTRRRRRLVNIPWGVARLQGSVLGLLPKPILTRDQVAQLRSDNIVADGALTLADLGVRPTAAEVILPTYLDRFRLGGRFSTKSVAT